MSGGDHEYADCGCVLWYDGGVIWCEHHRERAAMLRRAGVRPARRGAYRPDRPPAVKPPTKWERFVLRWLG